MANKALSNESLTAFFRDLLQTAMRTQAVRSSEDTEFYLVKLLEAFAHPETDWFNRPLALEYLESFHSPPVHRYGQLKRVADTSLFMSGMFIESLHRNLVSSEYYIQLGRTAYGHLSTLSNELRAIPAELFSELAERFSDFVRVLAEISFERFFQGDVNLVRVYTRWLYTRNEHDLRWLMRHGILPYVPPSNRGH